jgi:hypothetical protein
VLRGVDQQQRSVVARVSRAWQPDGLAIEAGDIVNVIGKFESER